MVIAVGFLMSDSTAAVAKRFPKTKFAIVDVNAPFMKGKPKNVRGIIFAEQEAGCLAGVAAATVSKTNVISSVGGLKIPPVDAFIAGYQYCAKKLKSGITTLNGYSQDFVAQDKCKEVALNQIGQDADVVFQVAGGCGLGVLQAAKDQKKWGIGVDNDQGFLGNHVLTSATKKVDVGVFKTIQLAKSKAWKGGVDGVFNVKNQGVGFGKLSKTAPNRVALANLLGKWSRTSPPARSSRPARSPADDQDVTQSGMAGGPKGPPAAFSGGIPPGVRGVPGPETDRPRAPPIRSSASRTAGDRLRQGAGRRTVARRADRQLDEVVEADRPARRRHLTGTGAEAGGLRLRSDTSSAAAAYNRANVRADPGPRDAPRHQAVPGHRRERRRQLRSP